MFFVKKKSHVGALLIRRKIRHLGRRRVYPCKIKLIANSIMQKRPRWLLNPAHQPAAISRVAEKRFISEKGSSGREKEKKKKWRSRIFQNQNFTPSYGRQGFLNY